MEARGAAASGAAARRAEADRAAANQIYEAIHMYITTVERYAAKVVEGDFYQRMLADPEVSGIEEEANAWMQVVNHGFSSSQAHVYASAHTKGAVTRRLDSLLASAVRYMQRGRQHADQQLSHLSDLAAYQLLKAPCTLLMKALETQIKLPASEPSATQLVPQLHDINLLRHVAAAVKEAPAMARRAADRSAAPPGFVVLGFDEAVSIQSAFIFEMASTVVKLGGFAARGLTLHKSSLDSGGGGSSSSSPLASASRPEMTLASRRLLNDSELLPAVCEAHMAMPPPRSAGLQGRDEADVLADQDRVVLLMVGAIVDVIGLAESVRTSPEAQAAHRRAPGAATGGGTSSGIGASTAPATTSPTPSGAVDGGAFTAQNVDITVCQEQARLLTSLLNQPGVVRLQRALVRRLCVRGLGAAGGEGAVEWWLLDEELRLGRPLGQGSLLCDADLESGVEVSASLQAWFATHLVARIAGIPLCGDGGGGTGSQARSGSGGASQPAASPGPAAAAEGTLPSLAEVAALGTKAAYALMTRDERRAASGTVTATLPHGIGLGVYITILQRLPEAMSAQQLRESMPDWLGMGVEAVSWGIAAGLRGARQAVKQPGGPTRASAIQDFVRQAVGAAAFDRAVSGPESGGEGTPALLLTQLWKLAEHEEVGLARLRPSVRAECMRRMREARLAPLLDYLLRADIREEEAESGSAPCQDDAVVAYAVPGVIARLLDEGAVELLSDLGAGADSGAGVGVGVGSGDGSSSSNRFNGGGAKAAGARPSSGCEPAGPDAHGEPAGPDALGGPLVADVPEDELGVIVSAAKHARLLAGRFEEVPRGDPSSLREWSTGRGRQGGRIPAILTLQLLASAFRNMRPQLSSRLEAAARAREAAAAQSSGGGSGCDPRVSCVGRAHQATAFALRSGCTLATALANLTAALAQPPEAERRRIESEHGNGVRLRFAPEAAAWDAAACACDMLGAWTDMASSRPPLPYPQLLASQPHRLMAATAQLLPALQPGGRLAGRVGGALAAALEAALGCEQLRPHALSWMAPQGGAVSAPATAAPSASPAPEVAPATGGGAVEAGLPPAPELRGCLRGPLEAAASQLAAASPGPAGRLRALLAPAAVASGSTSGGGRAKERPSGAQVARKRLGGQVSAPLPPLLSVPLRTAALPQLKVCANPRCSTFEQPSEQFLSSKKCGCELVWLCGQDCHVRHWRGGHNQECPAARRAR